MKQYVLKTNLPNLRFSNMLDHQSTDDMQTARDTFLETVKFLSDSHRIKVFFRDEPLRGRAQVEDDGFYYYVELFIKEIEQ